MDMREVIKNRISESIPVKQKLANNEHTLSLIDKAAREIITALRNGHKVLLCGNGGSASDASHIAGELVGRFQKERQPLPAIALNQDITSMTAIANDYSFDYVYEREVSGLLNNGDVIIGISTSGNSENVYRALAKAKELGGMTIGLLGRDGGKISDICDISIVVSSDVTARVQEAHIMIGHIICELVESNYE